MNDEIRQRLRKQPVSDSSFRIGTYGKVLIYVTGIGYTIQAFFREDMIFSVTDYSFPCAVEKFMKIFSDGNYF